MTESKSTKRALVSSAVAVLACIAMLVGTTFAWFTDTASTNVNKIQAGNLDVDIVNADGASINGGTLNFTNANGGTDILWEPGATFNLDSFKIANKGNLALKYKVTVNGVDGDVKLLEAIDFTVKMGNENISLENYEGHLAAGASTDLITLSGTMRSDAGNEYQGLSVEGISITVVATQDTVESDSFNNQYDANATYPVASAAELKSALTNGGTVTVASDIATNNLEDTAAARTVVSQPTTLNLDKKIISPDNMGNNDNNFAALYVDADTTINAGANGGIDTGSNGGYGINVRNGATLVINGGYYYGGGTAVQVQKGTLVINSGIFACEPYDNPAYGNKFLINCIDAAYKDGTAKIIIKGGTFINFDPSDSASENPHGNFVADGYKVVSETQTNGDVWYTVVAE